MTNRTKSHAICVAAAMALMTITPSSAFAFPAMPQDRDASPQARRGESPSAEMVQPGRLDRRQRARQNERQQAPAAPSAEAIMNDAKAFLDANNVACQMTEASFKGQTADGSKLFEVACANSFGYLALTSTPPMILNCLEISETQRRTLAADPNAAVGPKCELPANDNYMTVLASLARDAGISCDVNEGSIIGKRDGVDVYEIGCAGAEGYQITKPAQGWDVTSCLVLASINSTCNFTTKDEQIATVKSWFAGSPAAPCDVTQVRFMGTNTRGSFYEAACNGADGLIAIVTEAKTVEDVFPCADAAQIGGGCALTAGAPRGNNAPTS